jgi:Predicted hydrolase of the alpha/beta superfamily
MMPTLFIPSPARRIGLALLLAGLLGGCATSPAPAPASPAPPPLALEGTASHHFQVPGSGRRYPLWVSLPASYDQQPERHYPVLFVTDAPWSFPIIHGLRALMGRGDARFDEFILVGLPPQEGLSLRDSRSRDYTPTDPRQRAGFDPEDYEAPEYGQAAAWRDAIEQQVLPLVASHYRADMHRKVYAGHSYGGLFGSYVLLTRPQLFDTYILGSPSLWFDQGEIFRLEQQVAARRAASGEDSLPARVRLYIGSWERPGHEPRSYGPDGKDMVGDVQRFAGILQQRGYRGLQVDYRVVEGTDHGSVYPAFITDALVWALPGRNPKYHEGDTAQSP